MNAWEPPKRPTPLWAVGCSVILAVLFGSILAAIAVWLWRFALG